MSNNDNSGANFLEGLLLGAVIGGVLGVLFAPQSGEKSRAWLKNIKDENQDIIDSALNTSENIISSSKQAITEGFDKVAKMIETKLDTKKKPLK
jgi:gas vesicle protein